VAKWLLVVIGGVVVLGLLGPMLARLGLGRLPGDLRFQYRHRPIYLPITTTVLISLALTLLAKII
jgi:hypothetical protein